MQCEDFSSHYLPEICIIRDYSSAKTICISDRNYIMFWGWFVAWFCGVFFYFFFSLTRADKYRLPRCFFGSGKNQFSQCFLKSETASCPFSYLKKKITFFFKREIFSPVSATVSSFTNYLLFFKIQTSATSTPLLTFKPGYFFI